ncbi:MAG: hypothetical protein OEZ38_02185 [Gammaproteobacteria bacterium]|nr:hypothetical protein [Gammaproteobacteria bacterium]
MKPDTTTAMQNLIDEVRAAMPFDAGEAQLCADTCNGCSLKLLEFLDMELQDWEQKLQDGVKPSFGDIHKMGKTCKKVYMVLKKNGLIDE